MAKILFISDTFVNESLGIMCLSSYLKENGHSVGLVLLAEHGNLKRLLESVDRASPDLIGFSVMTPQVGTFREITRQIKNNSRAPVIWGGPHCMFMPEHVSKNEQADIICIGEGEEPLLELMNRIQARKNYEEISGLWVKGRLGWVKNDIGYLQQDLDKYPFCDRQLYYDKFPLLRNLSLKRVITQRGCPYGCSYCFEPLMSQLYKGRGQLVRRHSVRYSLDEVRGIKERYPVKTVHFSDDTFNLNHNWLKEFLPKYRQEVNLPFSCNISVSNINEEIARLLKESGCFGVVFGLESGVERFRTEVLNKKISDQKYMEACALLNKYKLRFAANIMFCLPGESVEDAVKSISFSRRLKPYNVRVSILKVYKGTGLADYIQNNGLSEEVGEFTYKVKDLYKEHESVQNMAWAGFLLVKVPGLLRFAEKLLRNRFAKLFKPLMLLYYWQEIKFLRIPPLQSLVYFWYSRKLFIAGLGGAQKDAFVSGRLPKESPSIGKV